MVLHLKGRHFLHCKNPGLGLTSPLINGQDSLRVYVGVHVSIHKSGQRGLFGEEAGCGRERAWKAQREGGGEGKNSPLVWRRTEFTSYLYFNPPRITCRAAVSCLPADLKATAGKSPRPSGKQKSLGESTFGIWEYLLSVVCSLTFPLGSVFTFSRNWTQAGPVAGVGWLLGSNGVARKSSLLPLKKMDGFPPCQPVWPRLVCTRLLALVLCLWGTACLTHDHEQKAQVGSARQTFCILVERFRQSEWHVPIAWSHPDMLFATSTVPSDLAFPQSLTQTKAFIRHDHSLNWILEMECVSVLLACRSPAVPLQAVGLYRWQFDGEPSKGQQMIFFYPHGSTLWISWLQHQNI